MPKKTAALTRIPSGSATSMKKRVPGSGKRWAGLLASLPPFPGKGRIIDTAALLMRFSGNKEKTASLWPGAPFSIDLSDRIHRTMWAGCYEPHVMRALRAILRPGDVFIDIGAHIGYHSYLAAGLVGAFGAVYAFEPDPGVFERLRRNLESFPAAHALNVALFEQDTEVAFERSPVPNESGWGTLTTVRDTQRGQRITVPCLSLDSWSSSQDLSRLRLIKLDAEGSEPRVVLGARRVLQQFRPVLVLELNGILLRQAGSSAISLQQLLRTERYTMYRIERSALWEIPVPVEFDLADTVAIPEEGLQEALAGFQRLGVRIMEAAAPMRTRNEVSKP